MVGQAELACIAGKYQNIMSVNSPQELTWFDVEQLGRCIAHHYYLPEQPVMILLVAKIGIYNGVNSHVDFCCFNCVKQFAIMCTL